jgi:hypothetical protein
VATKLFSLLVYTDLYRPVSRRKAEQFMQAQHKAALEAAGSARKTPKRPQRSYAHSSFAIVPRQARHRPTAHAVHPNRRPRGRRPPN